MVIPLPLVSLRFSTEACGLLRMGSASGAWQTFVKKQPHSFPFIMLEYRKLLPRF